jgi:hypothetical protein
MREVMPTTAVCARFIWCSLVGVCGSAGSDATRPDVLTLKNGDRLTGELKSLDRGLLSFDIDAATDTVRIEWDEVHRLTSTQHLEVRLDTGERHFGSLTDPGREDSVAVSSDDNTEVLPMTRVVRMAPIEDTFRQRLSGDISAGYNFTKASDVSQLNLGLAVAYEGTEHIVEASFDTLTTDSGESGSFDRSDVYLQHLRLLRDRWVVGQVAMLETNESLGIDLRSSFGGGAGRTLRQTNERLLALFGGAVITQERITDSNQQEDSVEALFGLSAQWFRYDEPELDVTTRFSVFPSLSQSGRMRTNLDVDFKWGITSDLFLGFTLYHNFDSDPPTVDAAGSDFGIVTSLGWEF